MEAGELLLQGPLYLPPALPHPGLTGQAGRGVHRGRGKQVQDVRVAPPPVRGHMHPGVAAGLGEAGAVPQEVVAAPALPTPGQLLLGSGAAP